MARLTYRQLGERYWKSTFAESFRKAGLPWEFFGDSLLGFVRYFYQIPDEAEVPPKVMQIAIGLERRLRREYAKRAAETRQKRRVRTTKQIEADV
jgi:hypothetical protein